jgi:hypothetical protein
MHNELKRLINIAGAALEAEDQDIRKGVTANNIAYPGGNGGILRFIKERYYQFITARSLTSTCPYPVAVEEEFHDLVLKHPEPSTDWFAVVEMKLWMSEDGRQEITPICDDLDKLRKCDADHALMLLFSANPHGSTQKNLVWLSAELSKSTPIMAPLWEDYCFPTINRHGEAVEFWVAGYQVK